MDMDFPRWLSGGVAVSNIHDPVSLTKFPHRRKFGSRHVFQPRYIFQWDNAMPRKIFELQTRSEWRIPWIWMMSAVMRREFQVKIWHITLLLYPQFSCLYLLHRRWLWSIPGIQFYRPRPANAQGLGWVHCSLVLVEPSIFLVERLWPHARIWNNVSMSARMI